MRALVTGARLPVAREIARALVACGVEVVAADSARFTCTGWSRYASAFVRLPPPAFVFAEFRAAVLEAVRAHRIDVVVPVNEEIFHLARFRDELAAVTRVPFESLDVLRRLHSKWEFLGLAAAAGLDTPESRRVDSSAQAGDVVLKREFSRGAFDVVEPGSETPRAGEVWVAQRRVQGVEHCTYSACRAGRVLAHAVYRPTYRVGRGAAVYFDPVRDPAIDEAVRTFVKHHNFSGQIAFDLIKQADGRLAFLECNPRATAGAHLLDPASGWARALVGDEPAAPVSASDRPCMAGPAALWCGLREGRPGELAARWWAARDVLLDWHDPLAALSQLPAACETLAVAWSRGVPAARAYTLDLEWNGE